VDKCEPLALGDYFIGDNKNSDSLTVRAETTYAGTVTNQGRALRQFSIYESARLS